MKIFLKRKRTLGNMNHTSIHLYLQYSETSILPKKYKSFALADSQALAKQKPINKHSLKSNSIM